MRSISGNNVFEVELRSRLLDAYGVPVEGAVVEVGIFDSQGNPTREGGGCYDANGNPLIDDATGLPFINQQECLDADDGAVWGYGSWIDEIATYGNVQIQTDADGYKFSESLLLEMSAFKQVTIQNSGVVQVRYL